MIFIHAKKTFLFILYKSAAIKYNHTGRQNHFSNNKRRHFLYETICNVRVAEAIADHDQI